MARRKSSREYDLLAVFAARVSAWLKEACDAGGFALRVRSTDTPAIHEEQQQAKRANLLVVARAPASPPLCLLHLIPPDVAADHPATAETAAQFARQLKARYFLTWNIWDAVLWETPKPNVVLSREHQKERYGALYQAAQPTVADLDGAIGDALRRRAQQIAQTLNTLAQSGQLRLFEVDARFFVERLREAVEVLTPSICESLQLTVERDRDYRDALNAWAVKQGITNFGDRAFFEAVARQLVYRLLGKIIFYQSLRRPELPPMQLRGIDAGLVHARLREHFQKAREIDYQAVFDEDIVERVPFPHPAIEELVELVEDLNRFEFSSMRPDVIGQVFEQLIPQEERHALGQYFTREDLVDFILGFCVRGKDAKVLDPTCGTGTFLLRAYDRLRHLGTSDHQALLENLWGVDIAPFPAELATINLFRQHLEDTDNFPRILCYDFFEVKPDQTFPFPPARAGRNAPAFVEVPVPLFDAVVGNFPFIRQELIEKQQKGYKAAIVKAIAEGWLEEYPDAFDLKPTQRRELEKAKEQGLPLTPLFDKVELNLSGLADIYAYLFYHAARFARPDGGRLGIITSNAWLDVGYGYELQRFFLSRFKVVAVLESRCEPWFEDAAVNTVVTILERVAESEIRNHLVRFVKVKRPLDAVISWDMKLDADKRWECIDELVKRIENAKPKSFCRIPDGPQVGSYEDEDFRIRVVKQSDLLDEVKKAGKTVKWGRYLRAPQVYFDLLSKHGSRFALLRDLADPAFGSKTELNAFFHLDDATITRWGVEDEYLYPLIKSPGDNSDILVDTDALKLKVFVCRKTKEELRQAGHFGALKYIEWGDQQQYNEGPLRGTRWGESPWLQDRKPGWWALPAYRTYTGQIFLAQAYGDKFIQRFSPEPLIADARLYFLSSYNADDTEVISAVLNSTVATLFVELSGRVTMGDGVLELKVEDARDYLLVPDVRQFDDAAKEKIVAALQPLLKRPIKSIFDEVKQPDRQALDRAVLEAMGLNADEYLPRIYEGLCALVRERTELGKMRQKRRKEAPKRDIQSLKEQVLADVLPDGVKAFPDDFLDPAALDDGFREVPVPADGFQIDTRLVGRKDLIGANGWHYSAKTPQEAKFLVYAHHPGMTSVRVPMQTVAVIQAVARYEEYLRQLKSDLRQRFHERTMNHQVAERLTEQVWKELGIKSVDEG